MACETRTKMKRKPKHLNVRVYSFLQAGNFIEQELTTKQSDTGFDECAMFIIASTPLAAIIAAHPKMITFTAPQA